MGVSAQELIALCISDYVVDRTRLKSQVAPEETWLEVIRLQPQLVRAVLLNKRLPEAVLAAIAAHQEPTIRSLVAMKRQASRETLSLLAHDQDEGVRALVARNPSLPSEQRDQLLSDPSGVVREAAREAAGRDLRTKHP